MFNEVGRGIASAGEITTATDIQKLSDNGRKSLSEGIHHQMTIPL
jgi:hypothetical protein